MNMSDELQKLQQMRQSGAISEDEFAAAKAKLLSSSPAAPADMERQTRQWGLILHLSQLAGFLLPLAGLIAPIVIWQIKKSDLPGIDDHGKVVVNWILSELIYGIVSFILFFVVVGFPLMLILMALAIIFPVVGGIKANNGEVWRYPLSIPFFK
jgi:uncharacterized protein